MQLSNNNSDVDLDVLSDYDWHIADLLQDIFEIFDALPNGFCITSTAQSQFRSG